MFLCVFDSSHDNRGDIITVRYINSTTSKLSESKTRCLPFDSTAYLCKGALFGNTLSPASSTVRSFYACCSKVANSPISFLGGDQYPTHQVAQGTVTADGRVSGEFGGSSPSEEAKRSTIAEFIHRFRQPVTPPSSVGSPRQGMTAGLDLWWLHNRQRPNETSSPGPNSPSNYQADPNSSPCKGSGQSSPASPASSPSNAGELTKHTHNMLRLAAELNCSLSSSPSLSSDRQRMAPVLGTQTPSTATSQVGFWHSL